MTTEVRVGGIPMHALGAVGDVTWTHGWPGGCLTASWAMAGLDRRTLPVGFHRNALVQLLEHGHPLWTGQLDDFTGVDTFSASGVSKAAENFPCADGDGDATTNLGAAIQAQIFNGWQVLDIPADWANVPAGVGSREEYQTLAAALTAASDAAGLRWGVNEHRRIFFAPDPTIPTLHTYVEVVGRADDDYFTHLIGRFVKSADAEGNPLTYDTVTRSDPVAAARPGGPSFRIVDLTKYGVMTSLIAGAVLAQLMNLGGARIGFSERIEVAAGDLLDASGGPAYLPLVKAGQMVRLHGALSPESAWTGQTYRDVVIAETPYTDGSGRIVLTPMGLAARTLPDIIKKL